MSFPKNVTYRKKKISAPFCKDCVEFLTGEGSMVNPWKCHCGTYAYDWNEGMVLDRNTKSTLSKKDAPL